MINKQDLINYFSEGIKKDNTLRIGTEHEKFIFKQNDLSLIPYDGDVSIQAIFQDFVKEGWKEVKEGNNTIALTKNNASITLNLEVNLSCLALHLNQFMKHVVKSTVIWI